MAKRMAMHQELEMLRTEAEELRKQKEAQEKKSAKKLKLLKKSKRYNLKRQKRKQKRSWALWKIIFPQRDSTMEKSNFIRMNR